VQKRLDNTVPTLIVGVADASGTALWQLSVLLV
jgi:hypothetical protein